MKSLNCLSILDQSVETYLNPDYLCKRHQSLLSDRFAAEGYVALPGFFSPVTANRLRSEVAHVETFACSKDFVMPKLNTARKMSTVGGQIISRESKFLLALYKSHELEQFLESVTGQNVYPCQHPNEFMVANFLTAEGNLHGFHLDSPAWALILFVETPPLGCGGSVEMIPRWREVCAALDAPIEVDVDQTISTCRRIGLVRSEHHRVGDAYLLRADKTMHRVTPLSHANVRRVALNFAYQQTRDSYEDPSVDELYSPNPPI